VEFQNIRTAQAGVAPGVQDYRDGMALSRRPTEFGYLGHPSPGKFRVTETFQVHFDVYKRKNNGVIHENLKKQCSE